MDAAISMYTRQTHSQLDFDYRLTRYCVPVTVRELLGMLSMGNLELYVMRVWAKAERQSVRRGKRARESELALSAQAPNVLVLIKSDKDGNFIFQWLCGMLESNSRGLVPQA